jgi:hypothetical protein
MIYVLKISNFNITNNILNKNQFIARSNLGHFNLLNISRMN